jgi:hypothetical protein
MRPLTLTEIDELSSSLVEPAKTITPVNPADPSRLGYPATFPIEIAMRTSSTREICGQYGITEDEWDLIRFDPTFLADLRRAVDMLAEEGMSFKVKARLQSEELLKTSWRMIHDPMAPHAVRADLIKFTVKAAGLDQSAAAAPAASGAGFSININLGNAGPNLRVVNEV